MTKKEYFILKENLLNNGYQKGSPMLNEDECYYKPVGRERNHYEEGRCLYQIFFHIWDFTKYTDPLFGCEISVMVSRTVEDRVELNLSPDKISIPRIERQAEAFFQFTENEIPLK